MRMAGAKMPWKPTTHSGVIVIHLLCSSNQLLGPRQYQKANGTLASLQIDTEGILACFRYCIVCIYSFLAYLSKSCRALAAAMSKRPVNEETHEP